MLVPLDGSKLSEVVFEYAEALADRLDLDLVLLHVCTPEESDLSPLHQAYIHRAAETLTRDFQGIEQDTEIQSRRRTIKIHSELLYGQAAEEILHYADTHDIDLILLATHGRTGIGIGSLGSVASQVISASKVPVWLVPPHVPGEIVYDEWTSNKILVPLDGSKLAECVLPHVESLTAQRGSETVEVILLKVCEMPYIPDYYADAMTPHRWREDIWQDLLEYENESKQYLAKIEKRLRKIGLAAHSQVLMGKPANEILGFVNSNPFNLIIMSTHGESGVVRWAYGSVVDKVLHGVSSPVFLVRPEEAHRHIDIKLVATGGRFDHV